jgi:hypothetical protein
VTVPITTTTTGSGPGGAGTTAAGAQPAKPAGVTPAAALVTLPRPLWLLLTYLAWQALMLALVAALYLRRSAQRLSA